MRSSEHNYSLLQEQYHPQGTRGVFLQDSTIGEVYANNILGYDHGLFVRNSEIGCLVANNMQGTGHSPLDFFKARRQSTAPFPHISITEGGHVENLALHHSGEVHVHKHIHVEQPVFGIPGMQCPSDRIFDRFLPVLENEVEEPSDPIVDAIGKLMFGPAALLGDFLWNHATKDIKRQSRYNFIADNSAEIKALRRQVEGLEHKLTLKQECDTAFASVATAHHDWEFPTLNFQASQPIWPQPVKEADKYLHPQIQETLLERPQLRQQFINS